MMKIFGVLAVGLMTIVCEAAEILAWRVPDMEWWERNGGVILENPPEISPFFAAGDELWDLKSNPAENLRSSRSLDWLVWNATSRRLVAKGDWADMFKLHQYLRPNEGPRQCRVTLECYQVTADGAAPTADGSPLAALSLISRSAQRATASWSNAGKSITIDFEATLNDSNTLIYMVSNGTVEVPGQSRMEFNIPITMVPGNPTWIARDFDGKVGLDLWAKVQILEVEEKLMIQRGDRTESLALDRRRFKKQQVEVGWIGSQWVSPDNMVSIFQDSPPDPNADPFAEPAPGLRAPFPELPSMRPPDALKIWVDHEVLDVRDWLRKIGVIAAETDFGGYDPISERIYLHSKTEEAMDRFESLFMTLGPDDPAMVITTLEGSHGQTRLLVRAGQKAEISRVAGEKSIQRLLEIEPTIGETDELIDMRLFFDDVADPQKVTRLNTAATLTNGKPLELLSGTADDGGKGSLRITGEVYRIRRK